MKHIHTYEEFLNESNTSYKIGDEFDPFGLAYSKNSAKPYNLEDDKGFHPNIMAVTDTLKITKIQGSNLIFNNGEYQIDKKDTECHNFFNKTKI